MPDKVSGEWADLCKRLRRIAGDVNWFSLRSEFDRLIAETRAGKDVLADWRGLEAEIARLWTSEQNQTIRDGEPREAAFTAFGNETLHRCPRGRCDREVFAPMDEPPTCLLFDTPMREATTR
ncbi:hypothetical protein [Amycolatopsis sp. NPDC098790]|uniref:hypothetical protein n=1 Tax=Amycolatopsis sp. NPDC098790 TaxID=3363939 RepID=UPI0037FDAD0A